MEGSPYIRDSERKIIHTCPFYAKWCSLLDRVYVYANTKRGAAYRGCVVCDGWLFFSEFKKWMGEQDWEGKELDKDILGCGKVYSPETCIFILPLTNKFLIDKTPHLGKHLQGVYFSKRDGKFKGQYSNPFSKKRVVKAFDNEESAHIFYLEGKIAIADKIAELEDDVRVQIYLRQYFRDKLENIQHKKVV